MKICLLFCILISAILVVPLPATQRQETEGIRGQRSPVPEMDRLAKALAGDWNTTERMARGELFPNGGERHGIVHVQLAAGGTTLIYKFIPMVQPENSMACW